MFDLTICERDEECDQTQVCDDGVCAEKPRVEVSDVIYEDVTWTKDRVWVLTDIITVQPSATLTIEPGTTILGEAGSALVVRAGGTLDATGTLEEPIVFTSAQPPGQRLPGDWLGVALLGFAPVNREEAELWVHPENQIQPGFGGSDPESYCGTLRYVRIEFAGGTINGDDYLNSLSLCGCGRQTVVDHVQLHFGGDDGLEIFGGTVDVRYIVMSRCQDQGLDIDLGWQGTGQYLAVQLDNGAAGSVDIDNLREIPDATPFTDFRIYNYTLIGSNYNVEQVGIVYKAGAGGLFSHGIIMGHGKEAVDVVGLEAGLRAMAGDATVLETVFYEIGDAGTHYFPIAGEPGEVDEFGVGDDDGGFAEDQCYTDPALNNVFDENPEINDAYNLMDPGWVPAGTSVFGAPPPPAPFDSAGTFRGAFAPGEIPWTYGWTAYPPS